MIKKLIFKERYKDRESPHFFEFESLDGKLSENQIGFGEVEYVEGSIYRGSLIYIDGHFEKYGFGEQNFLSSSIDSATVGGLLNDKLYKFVGFYDYRKTQWIYGNGILYFLDKDNKPSHFIKGFFQGTTVINKFKDFDKTLLLPGFSPDMEIEQKLYFPRAETLGERIDKLSNRKVDSLLIGDSWFEFYDDPNQYGVEGPFKKSCKQKSVFPLGIGGATFEIYNRYLNDFLSKFSFEKIIVHLGFNDVHLNPKFNKIVKNCEIFIERIKKINPNVDVYFLSVEPSPCYKNFFKKETKLNNYFQKIAIENKKIHFIDNRDMFLSVINDDKEFKSLFINDGLHLSLKGYDKWEKYFLDIID